MRRTPPFITPFAILSLIIILGASNVFENKVTHTNEGAPVRQTRVVNNQPRSRNVPNDRLKTTSDNQKTNHDESSSNSESKSDADSSRQSSNSNSDAAKDNNSANPSSASSNRENQSSSTSGNQSQSKNSNKTGNQSDR